MTEITAYPQARRLNADKLTFQFTMWAIAVFCVFFLLFPSVIIMILSFTDEESLSFPPKAYSLRLYGSLWEATEIKDAAALSFQVAGITAVVSVVLGVAGALAIGRSNAAWAKSLDLLFMSPLILPALAFGFAILMMFSLLGIRPSLITLSIGHIVVCVPFVLRTTLASLSQLDPSLLECSESLGAEKFYTFRRITFPLIKRGVFAGAFIAFMSSFDNVPVSLFLQDARTEVLPIHLWDIIHNQLDSRAAAASGALIILTVVLMLVMERMSGVTRFMK
jgi:putative spermidine/putrescine transport system permease protein